VAARAQVIGAIETLTEAHATNSRVGKDELTKACQSTAYSVHRVDVEIIVRQQITNRAEKGRTDLWCPFDLPRGASKAAPEKLTTMREQRVATKMIEASMKTDPESDGFEHRAED
jgi:hypothetical protein